MSKTPDIDQMRKLFALVQMAGELSKKVRVPLGRPPVFILGEEIEGPELYNTAFDMGQAGQLAYPYRYCAFFLPKAKGVNGNHGRYAGSSLAGVLFKADEIFVAAVTIAKWKSNRWIVMGTVFLDITCFGVSVHDPNGIGTNVEGEEAWFACMEMGGDIIRACTLLCLNAEVKPLDKPDPATRAGRMAAQAQRAYGWEYRVLTARPPAPQSMTSEEAKGTHASPRWHQRRGHWRSLPSGKRCWVKDCEVGDLDRGGVVKDYRIAEVSH